MGCLCSPLYDTLREGGRGGLAGGTSFRYTGDMNEIGDNVVFVLAKSNDRESSANRINKN